MAISPNKATNEHASVLLLSADWKVFSLAIEDSMAVGQQNLSTVSRNVYHFWNQNVTKNYPNNTKLFTWHYVLY